MTVKVWTYVLTALLLVTGCSKSEVITTYEQEVAKQAVPKYEGNSEQVPVIFNTTSSSQATTRANTTDDLL